MSLVVCYRLGSTKLLLDSHDLFDQHVRRGPGESADCCLVHVNDDSI